MLSKQTAMTPQRQWALAMLLPASAPGASVEQLCRQMAMQGHSVSTDDLQHGLTELSRTMPIQRQTVSGVTTIWTGLLSDVSSDAVATSVPTSAVTRRGAFW